MLIENKLINGSRLTWTLRCPTKGDAGELSELKLELDGETENLAREPGEDVRSKQQFETLIQEDNAADRNIFLAAEVDGKLVGYARCEGFKLSRYRHKADFGICILKEYWGYGIGNVLLEHILINAESAGVTKISLEVLQTNEKAIYLYKKYGFVEEGLLIHDRIHKDGNYYNTIMMGKILGE